MDDQITEIKDERLSFIDAFRQLVQFANIDQTRKEYFLNLLTEARYNTMTNEEAEELVNIAANTQEELEQKIIDSNDPEMINDLTELKEFTYSILNEAEEKGYRLILGDQASSNTNQAVTQKSGKWLLDKFAGLAE